MSDQLSSYSRKEAMAKVGRWTPYRKFFLMEAVSRGLLTRAEAQPAHGIGDEEWSQWTSDFESYGTGALRTTRTQHYRRIAP